MHRDQLLDVPVASTVVKSVLPDVEEVPRGAGRRLSLVACRRGAGMRLNPRVACRRGAGRRLRQRVTHRRWMVPYDRGKKSCIAGTDCAFRRTWERGRRLKLKVTRRLWMVPYDRGKKSCTAGTDSPFRRTWERGRRLSFERCVSAGLKVLHDRH